MNGGIGMADNNKHGKCDKELGQRVGNHLCNLGLEVANTPNPDRARDKLKTGVWEFLHNMGLLPDPSRDDTPKRVADMFVDDLCWGLDYANFPKCTTTPNGNWRAAKHQGQRLVGENERFRGAEFNYQIEERFGQYDQMVRVANIQTTSLCEHHLQTIYGWTHIAYIPGTKVLGLSKFARVTEFFARRPQIQERMTEQLHAALAFILETKDVAVVQDCEHFCMKARGAMQHSAVTRTDKVGGRFMSKPELRKEFFDGIRAL